MRLYDALSLVDNADEKLVELFASNAIVGGLEQVGGVYLISAPHASPVTPPGAHTSAG